MFTNDGGRVIVFLLADLALVLLMSPLLLWSFLLLQFLSAFCTFSKYALYHRRALVLLDWGVGLLPATFLGFPHRGVAGWIRVLVLVGLVWGCCHWDPLFGDC